MTKTDRRRAEYLRKKLEVKTINGRDMGPMSYDELLREIVIKAESQGNMELAAITRELVRRNAEGRSD